MKKYILISILLLALFSCNDNVVNNEYYSNIKTEFYTLNPSNWIAVKGSNIQWYQEFKLPTYKFSDPDKMGVMCYYLNQFDAWEALPSTRIFWTENDVVYSDELWFSHNLEYLYIDYRNTIPGVASPPKDKILIKAIYFDNVYNSPRSNAQNIDWNNYLDVKQKLNLKD